MNETIVDEVNYTRQQLIDALSKASTCVFYFYMRYLCLYLGPRTKTMDIAD